MPSRVAQPRLSRGRRQAAALVLALLAVPSLAREPGAAAIASAHPLATRAGFEALEAGGNAFDAAVAVAAALGVVEPYGSGLGGGGFWLLHRTSDAREVVVDAREAAAGAAHEDLFLGAGGQPVPGLAIDGPLAAAIPGTPAALDHLSRRYGRLPLSRSLAPAIRLAREGFEVSLHYRRAAAYRLDALSADPDAAATFLVDGEVPPEGHRVVQPDLARTLEVLAREGAGGFYRGDVAARLVAGVRGAGGIWTEEDLARYRVVERAPVTGEYRGWRVTSAPPPSSGGVALVGALNILAGYDLDLLSVTARRHLVIESLRRVYRDRAQHLGDPDWVAVPVERLTHPLYAAGLRAGIHPGRATPSEALPGVAPVDGGTHTTHFSVLDAQGNRVGATLTINYPFGAALVPPGTGVLLNDQMDDFSVRPGVPNAYGLIGGDANAIAPGKRPLSSMSPTFVESARGVAILGTPGGSRIISAVLLATLDLAHGRGPEEWVSRPRYHHQYLPDEVQHEPGALTEAEAADLRALGHRVRALDAPYGNMQAVYWDRASDRVLAVSDSRGEGLAEVRPAPPPDLIRSSVSLP
jgi:gamma-glutamyltranspeptidase/glutathione hydrolase